MIGLLRRRKLKRIVRQALADDELSDQELEDIAVAAQDLGVPMDYVRSLRNDHFRSRVAPLLQEIRKNRRFSREQEKRVSELCESLRFNPQFDNDLMICRKLWEIESSGTFEPEPIAASIRLSRNEHCYHAAESVWAQMKVLKHRQGYAGASIGFRVAKGVTLRLGRAVPVYTESEELVDISAGTLYVTNKKLVFVGEKRSTNITFGRLVSHDLYRDAVQINKSSGSLTSFGSNRSTESTSTLSCRFCSEPRDDMGLLGDTTWT